MKKILITTLLLLSTSSYASQLNVQALEACSLVENDLKRLMCYDKVMAGKQITQTVELQSIKKAPAIPAPAKAQTTTDSFGLENKKAAELKQLDEIEAEITKLSKDQFGKRTFTLSNGQVWRQKSSDAFTGKKGDRIIIIRGAFDSFRMKKAGTNRTIQVTRVK